MYRNNAGKIVFIVILVMVTLVSAALISADLTLNGIITDIKAEIRAIPPNVAWLIVASIAIQVFLLSRVDIEHE